MDYLERGRQDPDWIENDKDPKLPGDHPRYVKLIDQLRAATN